MAAKKEREMPLSKCGCGERTKGGIFRPGHDAKYHSMMKGPKPMKVNKQVVISTVSEIAPFVSLVRSAAADAVNTLRHLAASEPDGLEVLRQIKFKKIGRHPLEDRPLNLI